MDFEGKTENGDPVADWDAVYAAAAKHRRFMIKVLKWSDAAEISREQTGWLHCKDGPYAHLSEFMGCSLIEAELYLKVNCGRDYFVEEVIEENVESLTGHVRYECLWSFCRKLVHPARIHGDMLTRCPYCDHGTLGLINIKSKKSQSVAKTNEWFKSIYTHMEELGCPIEMPDKDWKQKGGKK